MKYFFITIFCVLISGQSLYAQDYKSDLSIRIHYYSNGKEFITEVFRKAKRALIVFTREDSISKEFRKDERFVKFFNALNSKDSSARSESKSIDFKPLAKIIKEYTYYSKDSVRVNLQKHRTFEELLSKVADPADNEPEIEMERMKNRHILDGTAYLVQIKTVNQVRTFQLSSPTPASHPLFYKIIHEPLKFKKF